jgi:pimeloyl-ACP methyl ester carboxylesterase
MQTPQDCYITVGQINTRYWVEGSRGSPVLLIHGLGGFAETWLLTFGALAAHHRVYAIDLPGHGRSAKQLDWACRATDLARFVKGFMAAVGIECAHLVGHSLGGAVSAHLALMFPEMVDRLVLVSSAGLGRELSVALRLGTVPLLGEILTRPGRAKIAQSVGALINAPEDVKQEAVAIWYEIASQPGSQRGTLRTLRANANPLGQHPSQYGPIVAGLGSITHPTLIIWGRQDAVVPLAHARAAARELPNVRLEILEPCGHVPMLEQPDTFRKLVLEFLED